MPIPAITPAQNCPAPAENQPSIMAATGRRLRACWGLCSWSGPIYYHCAQCQSGFCPRDRHLGLEMFSLTPGVLRMTGSAAALVSFVESGGLLRELAGVEVSASQVERAAEALGAEIAAEEHNCVEPAGDVAPTMCLGMDGTAVPMRNSEVAGRAGKQPDGSAKTREAKVVTIWTAESRDDQGKPMRDPGSVTYSAAIESAAARDTHPERASALLLLSFGGIKPHQPDLAPLHQSNSPPTGLLSSHSLFLAARSFQPGNQSALCSPDRQRREFRTNGRVCRASNGRGNQNDRRRPVRPTACARPRCAPQVCAPPVLSDTI